MITSHRDRRAFQNYDYNSRSAPFFYLKSQIMGGIMYAPGLALANRLDADGCGCDGFPASREKAPTFRPGPWPPYSPLRRFGRDQMRE